MTDEYIEQKTRREVWREAEIKIACRMINQGVDVAIISRFTTSQRIELVDLEQHLPYKSM